MTLHEIKTLLREELKRYPDGEHLRLYDQREVDALDEAYLWALERGYPRHAVSAWVHGL